jgi:hypothetical protein
MSPYFVRNLRLAFNFNYVLVVITIMAINPYCHRWEVTTCTKVFKTTNSNWNNQLANNLWSYIPWNNLQRTITLKTRCELQPKWKFHEEICKPKWKQVKWKEEEVCYTFFKFIKKSCPSMCLVWTFTNLSFVTTILPRHMTLLQIMAFQKVQLD